MAHELYRGYRITYNAKPIPGGTITTSRTLIMTGRAIGEQAPRRATTRRERRLTN